MRAAVDRLAALGAEVGEASLPHAEYALSAYYLIAPSEASSNLARYDGVRYGLRVDGEDSIEMMFRTRGEGFGPEVKRRIMLGTYALSAGYYDAYYGQAQKVRTLSSATTRRRSSEFDVLVSPTSPTTAFPIGEKADDPLAMYLNDIFTIPANLARGAGDQRAVRPRRRRPADRPAAHRAGARRGDAVPCRRRPGIRPRARPPAPAARGRLSLGDLETSVMTTVKIVEPTGSWAAEYARIEDDLRAAVQRANVRRSTTSARRPSSACPPKT